MKQNCKECGIKKELSEFYSHPQGKNGVLGRCKECIKRGRRSEKERKLARKWERENRIRPKGYEYLQTKKYRKENPEKYKAHKLVNNFLRYKNYNFKCVVCGTNKYIEKHHEDYDRPNEIIPFCSLHHKRYHCGDFRIKDEWKIILPF